MTIGVDSGCLSLADERLKVGVYQFGFQLLKSLAEIDKKNKYLLYSFAPIEEEILRNFSANFENHVLRPKKGWLNFRLSLEFLFNQLDIFLGLSQALPIFHPPKNIIFVHDLAFELYPECYPDSYNKLSRQTKYAVKHADKIVAVSNSTKNDLVNFYGVDLKKTEVIYHGVDPIFKPQGEKEIKRVKDKYKLGIPYFLFLGSLKPIKNVPRIVQAFSIFLEKIKKPYKLVLAGSDYWLDKEIPQTIEKLKLENQTVILGYTPKEDLPSLFSGAVAFVSPSFYEGFGLPLLEAMACGVPVITSNASSMPEVVGKAGLLVEPESTKKMSQAMSQLVTNKELSNKLRLKGWQQVKKFSWQKSAEKLLKIIKMI